MLMTMEETELSTVTVIKLLGLYSPITVPSVLDLVFEVCETWSSIDKEDRPFVLLMKTSEVQHWNEKFIVIICMKAVSKLLISTLRKRYIRKERKVNVKKD